MIVCTIEHLARYESVHPRFAKAIAFLKDTNFSAMEVGKIEIDGSDLYALVQRYETVNESEKKWESHEKYMDIQYVASGSEILGWAAKGTLTTNTEYNQDKDIIFYQDSSVYSPVLLEAGSLAILMPEDLHKPGCIAGKPEAVTKIVIKIKI